MVLAVSKLKRSESIAKRRICERKMLGKDIARSSSDSKSRVYTDIHNKLFDAPKTPADANEDNSYIATLYERQWHETNWKLTCNTQGKNGPLKVR